MYKALRKLEVYLQRTNNWCVPILADARSAAARVAGIVGSNPAGAMDVCLL
jgi:hypothetical protein